MVKKEGCVVRIEGCVVKKCKTVVKTLKTVVKINCIMCFPGRMPVKGQVMQLCTPLTFAPLTLCRARGRYLACCSCRCRRRRQGTWGRCVLLDPLPVEGWVM